MNSKRRQRMLYAEIIIVILIATSVMFILNFSNNKMDEVLTSEQEALLMSHDPNDPLHAELAKEIIKFRPNACKMIEVYAKDLTMLFKVQFMEDEDPPNNNITEYPELMDLLMENEDGHTSIQIGDKDEDVYFRWTRTDNDELYLVIIYMSRHVVDNLWVFPFMCYMILLLVFILLMLLIFTNNQNHIRMYEASSQEVQNRMTSI